ncbi:formin-like protein 14 isoform X2 [Lolium rigidum]|uniref:formin-like protein 14 isoform X2 n=1 Tax=Lolium rigidum TaxID=89674 RepID=UPI001F5E0DE8|nr:formin-like protein 14 isoform X2 [Lolium rigidum]
MSSDHFSLRSSVGSHGSAPPSHHHHQQHHQHVTPYPRPHGNPDPLASVWIRRLHLAPNPPPPPPPPHSGFAPPPPPHEHEAVSNRSAGFGPFRWSPRPQRDAPAGAWDAAPAPPPAPPMTSPFFRSQPPPLPLPAVGEFAPVRTAIGFGAGAGSGLPGLSSRATVHVYPHSSWLATPAAGSAYPNHAVDMVPMRNSHDLHVRQHGMIPRYIPRPAPSSSSQNEEPFSYWNMGRFQRSTTTSSISQVAAMPDNFVKKRSADTNGFLP